MSNLSVIKPPAALAEALERMRAIRKPDPESYRSKLDELVTKHTHRISLEEAERVGWRVLAGGIETTEEWMLRNFVADLTGLSWPENGAVKFIIVRTKNRGTFIMRRGSEMLEVH